MTDILSISAIIFNNYSSSSLIVLFKLYHIIKSDISNPILLQSHKIYTHFITYKYTLLLTSPIIF